MRIRKPLSLLFVGLILSLTLLFASSCTIVLPEGLDEILGDLGNTENGDNSDEGDDGGSDDTEDSDSSDDTEDENGGADDENGDNGTGDENGGDEDEGADDDNTLPCTHVWQAATCKAPATCSVCGATDGEKADHTPEEDDGDCTTAERCAVCNKTLTPASSTHIGGRATCTELAKCSVCGMEYGELAIHAESVIWIKRLDVHYQAYACCLERVTEDEAHTSAFDCTVCGFLPTVNITDITAASGDTVSVKLSIEDNPAILAMSIEVIFNDSALTLTGATAGDALSKLTFTASDSLASGAKFMFDGTEIAESDVKDGEILQLEFDISDTAREGDYMIQISIVAYDNDLSRVDFAVAGGKITVEND